MIFQLILVVRVCHLEHVQAPDSVDRYLLIIYLSVGRSLLQFSPEVFSLAQSVKGPSWLTRGAEDIVMTDSGTGYPFFLASNMFDSGVNQKNQSASELWLSAYIGNYIGNCLSFLNDILQRVEIEPGTEGSTKLLVKWGRVAGILGGLVVFQVLSGIAALLYCHRNFEIVDDVPTFSSMFTGFPFGSQAERRQEGRIYKGRFVAEGDGFRWVFEAGAGKDKIR